ncbi:MAG: hypothetical protein ABL874_06745 [Sphingopyxis sp.]
MTAIVRRAQSLFGLGLFGLGLFGMGLLGSGAAAPAARAGLHSTLWRELFTGPGPLWWRALRWSQRARASTN